MSTVIEYCQTVNDPQDIVKKSDELKEWIDVAANSKWSPLSYKHKEVLLFDKPQEDQKHILMTKTVVHASAKQIYEYLINSSFEEQKAYDKDMISFERTERSDESGCEIARVCYSAPWPVAAREFVGVQNWYERNGKYYLTQESVNYPHKWSTPDPKFVRGYKKSGMILDPISDSQTQIHRVIVLDARGSIPGWLASTAKKDDAGRLLELKHFFEKKFGK
ncbi:START domain-containing protein [Entamoeba marina]